MVIDTRTKVSIKSGTLEMLYVELRAKKLHRLPWIHVHRIFSYSHVQNMPQPHRQSMKFRNMIVNIKIKVLIQFGTSGMLCEEFRAKMVWKLCRLLWMHVHRKFSYAHEQYILQPHRQSTKLRNMIVNITTKVLFKFGTSEMMCEEFRAKKLWKLYWLL